MKRRAVTPTKWWSYKMADGSLPESEGKPLLWKSKQPCVTHAYENADLKFNDVEVIRVELKQVLR